MPEIADLLECYRAAWYALDPRALSALWDEEDEELTYSGPELGDLLVGYPAIALHLSRMVGRLTGADLRISELMVKSLGPDLSLGLFLCSWQLSHPDAGLNSVSHGRVTAIFRRRGSAWRFIHYAEDAYHVPGDHLP
jgi:hypothetical protein